MDKLYQESLQKFNDTVALKYENISNNNTEQDKYQIPKPLSVASHNIGTVTPQNTRVIDKPIEITVQLKPEHLQKLLWYKMNCGL